MSSTPSLIHRQHLLPALALLLALSLLLSCGVLDERQEPAPTPTASAPVSSPAATSTADPTAPVTSPTPASETLPTTVAPAPDPGPAPAFPGLDALADYATAAEGDPEAVAAAVRAWGMEPQAGPSLSAMAQDRIVVAADLTGDGQEELIVLTSNPVPQTISGEGNLTIMSAGADRYEVQFDALTDGASEGLVSLLAVQDINGDGRSDVAYASESCGAHTCMADVRVLSYQSDDYLQLASGITAAYPDLLALEDRDGDSVMEIVVHGNVIGSVGAGPQRASTLVYRLLEGRYRLSEVEYDPSDLLYFRVVDGNIALAQGTINEAIAIYTEVIQNDSLQASGVFATPEEEVDALRSFARFRLIVAYAMQEEPSTGRELALIRAEAGPFVPAAEAFWAGYAETRSIEAGCAAVAEVAEIRPEMLDLLNSYGYANPFFTELDLCRGTGTGLPEPVAAGLDPGSCAGCG
ncbi:MAG: VCBS repeat-containing protein [Anaerolineae bacterium]|nr:VCBS repeat-containing protein [Anaerolineae bacterium]